MRKWLVLITLACLSVAHATETVTFQYKLTKGQVIRHHLQMKMQMSIGPMETNMDMSMSVDEVKDDGTALVTTKIEKGQVKVMGMKMGIPGAGKEYHATISKNGHRIESGKDKNTVAIQEFPDHPVAVGESWDGTVQTAAGRGQVEVNAHFTLESVKIVDGHKIAHIAMVEDGGTTGKGAVKIHATGWMEWDLDRGVPLGSHLEGTQDAQGMSGTFTTEMTPITD